MISFPFFRYRYPGFYYPYYNNYIKKSHLNNNLDQSEEKTDKVHYGNLNNQISDLLSCNNVQNHESYQTSVKQKNNIENKTYNKKNNKTSKYNLFDPIRFNNNFLDGDFEDPIIEILGIELYLDDLILIGLLFLLYNENIQDEILFISLIILLLS